jgi:hypothetical protein
MTLNITIKRGTLHKRHTVLSLFTPSIVMLSVTIKPNMLSVVLLNVVALTATQPKLQWLKV